MKEEREFQGVWIPAQIYLDESLSWTQKLMLVEVSSFTRNGLECFVSDEHFSRHLQISVSAVEKNLKALCELGYLQRRKQLIKGFNRRLLRVVATINYGSHPQKSTGSTRKKVRVVPTEKYGYTNTVTKSLTSPKKEGKPNSLEECVEFFKELQMEEQAELFMDWYEQTGWKLKGGNTIKDWKATARNWARRTQTFKQDGNKGFKQSNFTPSNIERFVTEG